MTSLFNHQTKIHTYAQHALAFSLAEYAQFQNKPLLIVTESQQHAEQLSLEINFFLGEERANVFCDWETLPYDQLSPHQDIVSKRLSILYQLASTHTTNPILVAAIDTVMHRLAPISFTVGHALLLKKNDLIHLSSFRDNLVKSGYYAVPEVRESGQFAIRGSIIDLYPMGAKYAYRLDLFDDCIDQIRIFSTDTQLSTEAIEDICILPAKELVLDDPSIDRFKHQFRRHFSGNPLNYTIYQNTVEGTQSAGIEYYLPFFHAETHTLFDYLKNTTQVFLTSQVREKAIEFEREIQERYQHAKQNSFEPACPPELLFLTLNEIEQCTQRFTCVSLDSDETNLHAQPSDVFFTEKNTTAILQQLKELPLQHIKILICAESSGRKELLLEKLNANGIQVTSVDNWCTFAEHPSAEIVITQAPLENGFFLKSLKWLILTEADILLNHIPQQRRRKKKQQGADAWGIQDLSTLKINDPIVHIQHGVGRYLGLSTLHIDNQPNEFLMILYDNQDKLYVPINSLQHVSRYSAGDAALAPLHKLGTERWQKSKRKAVETISDVACELLELYAKRLAKKADAFTLPKEDYDQFCNTFPFEETDDQLTAEQDILNDLHQAKPMDRIICGDVGFGKTEIAMRAAFLTVYNQKQVAVLTPTTLLTQQHLKNFQDRFSYLPVQIAALSRFQTKKEQESVMQKLREGKVDIVIGTHKLLQKNIGFKQLGMIILDEEHRFGVKQKEQLKTLKAEVHLLTLTATPIPRTLNFALSGLRDLSIIATPPAKRLSVKTFLIEHEQKQIIKEAMQREILRGGQVYYLHNNVSTIEKISQDLQRMLPEARTVVAHGQLPEAQLEKIMVDFYHRRYNVLICTTIIESGIDIPTANTIIIDRADQLGLSQLHQLRGRVGRSHHQAYAYLITPPKKQLNEDAKKRLEAFTLYGSLGVGFALASQDLEIRGAGELLGDQQSGHVHEIGFNLYMDLLNRAVDQLKKNKTISIDTILTDNNIEIDLHISAIIPEDYICDVETRLRFYKKFTAARDEHNLDQIQIELIDRFGLLPDSVKNLVKLNELRLQAEDFGVQKIEIKQQAIRFRLHEKNKLKTETFIKLIQQKNTVYFLDGKSGFQLKPIPTDPQKKCDLCMEALLQLSM